MLQMSAGPDTGGGYRCYRWPSAREIDMVSGVTELTTDLGWQAETLSAPSGRRSWWRSSLRHPEVGTATLAPCQHGDLAS